MGVMPVRSWDKIKYSLDRNPVTRAMMLAFDAAAARSRAG
jgi:hypothetical protein